MASILSEIRSSPKTPRKPLSKTTWQQVHRLCSCDASTKSLRAQRTSSQSFRRRMETFIHRSVCSITTSQSHDRPNTWEKAPHAGTYLSHEIRPRGPSSNRKWRLRSVCRMNHRRRQLSARERRSPAPQLFKSTLRASNTALRGNSTRRNRPVLQVKTQEQIRRGSALPASSTKRDSSEIYCLTPNTIRFHQRKSVITLAETWIIC